VDLKPAYLIAGGDWAKVDAAVKRLLARFPEEAVEQLSGLEPDVDVVSACNSLGLLGGARLVLVRAAESLPEPQAAAIATYLKSPAPDTCLALFGGAGIGSSSALARAVAAVGDVRLFEPPDARGAAEWVVRRFAELGVECPQPVARRIVELVGEDAGDLALEVEKVATCCTGGQPDRELVDRLVIAHADVKPWEVTDAWGRRDAAAAIALVVADVERPGDVSRVVAQLAAHIGRVTRAARLLDAGADTAAVQKQLKMRSPYAARKLCEQARRFSSDELGRATVRLAELDLAVKGGSRLDARLELELALADIAAP
jgi:DNA polymerase III delta subunit